MRPRWTWNCKIQLDNNSQLKLDVMEVAEFPVDARLNLLHHAQARWYKPALGASRLAGLRTLLNCRSTEFQFVETRESRGPFDSHAGFLVVCESSI